MSSKTLLYRKILASIVEKDTREVLPSRQKRLNAAQRFLERELGDLTDNSAG